MNHLYLHIPFCKTRCIYCDFPVSTHYSYQKQYIEALLREIRTNRIPPPRTMYFGGGTPSSLPFSLWEKIAENLPLQLAEEVTMEINPEDLQERNTLNAWQSLGIRRFSLGVQSLHETSLKHLNRRHTREESLKAMKTLADGADNWSVDLLIGIQGEDWHSLKQTLEMVLSFHPPHLSLYMLESKSRNIPKACDDVEGELALQAWEYLASKGYLHYEISNFALPGYFSLHNLAYWTMEPFLGVGLGAHSYDGEFRFWNTSNIQRYLEKIFQGESPVEGKRPMTPKTKREEALALGLRTMWGVSESLLEGLEGWEEWLEKTESGVRVKEKYWLVLDELLSKLWAQLDRIAEE